MTWKEFNDGVRKLLTADADRVNIQDFIDLNIRAAAIDLQGSIETFTLDHSTIIPIEDMVPDGDTMWGYLPDGAEVTGMETIDDEDYVDPGGDTTKDASRCYRTKLYPCKWEDRHDLACGRVCPDRALYAIGPDNRNFYIYPKVEEDVKHLVIHWNGTKLDFNDNEEINFPEQTQMAVYYWVKGHILSDIDSDVAAGLRYYNEVPDSAAHYQTARRNLWSQYHDGPPV